MGALSFDNIGLPDYLDARVRSELRDGERLRWVGQPRHGLFTGQALGFVLLGLPFTAFGLHWMSTASGAWSDHLGKGWVGAFQILFSLIGSLPVLVGVGMLSSPYWLRRKAKRTCYVLTDRRAILWEASWFRSFQIRSYKPGDLTKIRCVEYSNGGGDLVFEEVTTIGEDSDGFQRTTTERHGFMGIDSVREIEKLLRKTLNPIDREATEPAVRVDVLKPERSIPDPPTDSTIRLNVGCDGTEFVRRCAFSLTALKSITFITFINLFWNGILGVFLMMLLKKFEWFLFFFLIPFEAVGLALLTAWLATLLAPFCVERWVIGSGEAATRFSFLGLGWTRRFEAKDLGRIELRKGALGRGEEIDAPCSLGFVSREGRDLLVADGLSEGEARWMGGVACNALKGWLPKDGGQW